MIRKLCIVSALCLFGLYSICLAKPLPPNGLDNVFEQLTELEESYENGEWNQAAKVIGELEEELNKINNETPADYQLDFNNSIKGLQYAINKRDAKLAEKGYMRLSNDCIKFCNSFQFDIHPLFSIIKKYLGEEATEASEKSEYEEVISEVREVANILNEFKDVFNDNGIDEKEIKELQLKLNSIVAAAQNKDPKLVKETLETTNKYFNRLYSESS